MIDIIKDIDLIDEFENYDLILVPVNTYNKMSNGFSRKIRRRFPITHEKLMETNYADIRKLGTILLVEEIKPQFCLCFITESYNFRPDKIKDYLNYEALEKCLIYINNNFQNIKIACPPLGSSRFDGNGDKDKIISIFNRVCVNIDITIYDYFQKSNDEENKESYLKIKKHFENGDYEVFKELLNKRKEKIKKYGHF